MNSVKEDFHIAVPTAFHADESLNIEETLKHIDRLYQKGVRSVMICGSTGEQHSLSTSEKIQLIDSLDQEARFAPDLEILVGVSGIRQKEVLRLAERVERSNAIKAVLLGYPPYLVPSQAEAVCYTEKVLEKLSKPVILYNNPLRTGFDLAVESILHLFDNHQIIGIKEAGDPEKIQAVQKRLDRTVYYYAGGEQDLEKKISLGFNRLSSIAGNVWPQEISNWFFNLLEGKNDDTDKISLLLENLYNDSFLVQLKKLIIATSDVQMGNCRAPLGNLEKE
ncbi:hypothetical protein PP7435_CHR1-0485 [Komagataella phaffii CBS 7435]|uniref:Dihydrodipicolinate synthase family protein n=1 Tax=Komagataella phaffii (strain ATCC 76273 / CBS 7435 / CECT 11047 / NRRL Y-11430 / Wegner 21-1) TaxID=981350 RepID=F2QMJ0_KOMPC|nr:GQ67_02754T0 [Komagataella phaffii]AOA66712.1 GQ68_02494T0 [Komagataella phaffii GS115]CAH2446210.1 hypothetical protein BQ9382_C1-2515 [Komagataella phaffii CBS 7435]CCA36637.1 hypothetical protein PP7435_CHR1-0485 [Komagataella phaffii CBS 7435]